MPPPSRRPRGRRKASAATARPQRLRLGLDGQRERIVEGGLRVLETRPYDQVTVQDILDAAKVSRQTFYRCFDGKSALYHRIFERGNTLFLEGLRSLDKSGGDPVAIADRALTGALMFVIYGGPMLRALYRETIRSGSEFAHYRVEVMEALIRDIAEWTHARMSPDIEPTVIRALVLTVEQLLFALAGEQQPTPEAIERSRQAILLIVRGVHDEIMRRAGAPPAEPR